MGFSSTKITTNEIAKMAQVSVGTVSRVITNQPNVDNTLRARVLKVISETGYIHNPRKRSSSDVTSQKENADNLSVNSPLKNITFGVPIRKSPAFNEPYFYQVLHGVEDECTRRKIDLMYQVIPDDPASLEKIAELRERGLADGLILVNYASKELIEGIQALKAPVILIDPQQPVGLKVDVIISDFYNGTTQAMQYLFAKGHRKIALINGPSRYSTKMREQSYRINLEEMNLPFDSNLIVSDKDQVPEGGEEAVEELLSRKLEFTAIVCANDNMGLGANRALLAAGLNIPQDVSVVGYDDHGTALLATPTLTTMHANNVGKGSLAVRRLVDRALEPENPTSWSIFPAYLVERNSTGSLAE